MKRLLGLCIACTLCAVLAACGSSSSSSTTSTVVAGASGGANAAALTKARVAAAGCMRSQGIDLPDPNPGAGGLQGVLRACRAVVLKDTGG